MFEALQKKQIIYCPNCQSANVRRSRTRKLEERIQHVLLFKSPYRCMDCDQRFFRNRLFFRLKHTRHHAALREGAVHR